MGGGGGVRGAGEGEVKIYFPLGLLTSRVIFVF